MRKFAATLIALMIGLTLAACKTPSLDDLRPKAQETATSTQYAGNFRPYEQVDTDAERIALAKQVVPTLTTVSDDYAKVDGYERECSEGKACVFGPSWHDDNGFRGTGNNGCDTRNDVLAAQLQQVTTRSAASCTVTSGTYTEPYFGTQETFVRGEPQDTQDEIDHVFPLRAAWDLGAHAWTPEQRRVFANDTELNLQVTTRKVNSKGNDVDGDGYTDRKDLGEYPGKSAKTASQWLEWLSDDTRACNYAARYALIAERYGLSITKADATAITDALSRC